MSEGGTRGPAVQVPPKPQAVSPARGGMTPAPPRVAPPLNPAPVAPAVSPRIAPPLPPLATTPKMPPVVAHAGAGAVAPLTTAPSTTPGIAPSLSAPPPPPAPNEPHEAVTPPSMIPVAFASEAPREMPIVAAARRADEMRAEIRGALEDVLEDTLAPILKSIREIERRLEELEKRPPTSVTPPSVVPTLRGEALLLAATAQALRHDPFASVPAPAMRTPQPSLPTSTRAPSPTLDFDVPFDGAKRRKKLAVTLGLLLVVVFGGLLAALLFSYNRGG